jgi:hypothetical protein
MTEADRLLGLVDRVLVESARDTLGTEEETSMEKVAELSPLRRR